MANQIMEIARLKIPNELLFGNGSASQMGIIAKKLGASRVLLISDRGLESTGVIDEARQWLVKAGLAVEIWLDVEAEPSVNSLDPCLHIVREEKFDAIVGLGGGSVLDTAKATAVLVDPAMTIYDLLGQDHVTQPGLPTILLPTTAGTGAEITPNALFYLPEKQAKEAIVSHELIPDVAIIDPMLALSAPPGLTAATGMDALCHAIESYTGLNATPLSMPFSRESIRLIGTHLRTATIHGDNLTAREGMALGSLNAAIAIANAGTNGVHALAYPLQGLERIQHGIANSLLLPYVMEFNMLGAVERFAEIAYLLGIPTHAMSQRQAAEASVYACRQLSIDIGIPQSLQLVGIKEDDLENLVDGAMKVTRLLKNNPRPINREDIRRIFHEAF